MLAAAANPTPPDENPTTRHVEHREPRGMVCPSARTGGTMRRVRAIVGITLAATLLLAQGVAAQVSSPSPAATPIYAPEDMAFALPYQIDGRLLDPVAHDGEWFVEQIGQEAARDLLVPLDREPTDVRAAVATPDRTGDEPYLSLFAIRIDGVEGARLAVPLTEIMFGTNEGTDDGQPWDWIEIDGRAVLAIEVADVPGAWALAYPKGEVVFFVGGESPDPQAAMEAVVTELP